jgi:hypothetical protein
MHCWTRLRFFAVTWADPLITALTVPSETPASFATSRMVGRRGRPLRISFIALITSVGIWQFVSRNDVFC